SGRARRRRRRAVLLGPAPAGHDRHGTLLKRSRHPALVLVLILVCALAPGSRARTGTQAQTRTRTRTRLGVPRTLSLLADWQGRVASLRSGRRCNSGSGTFRGGRLRLALALG